MDDDELERLGVPIINVGDVYLVAMRAVYSGTLVSLVPIDGDLFIVTGRIANQAAADKAFSDDPHDRAWFAAYQLRFHREMLESTLEG